MKTRFSTLFLALSACCGALSVQANTSTDAVTAIEAQLFDKHAELKAALTTQSEQQESVAQHQQTLKNTQQQATKLNAQLETAKSDLESAYQRMIDDPNIDIAAVQAHYQSVWRDIKQNQQQLLSESQTLEEAKQLLEQHQAHVNKIETEIEQSNQQKLRARVDRLKQQLSPSQQISVSFTNRCQSEMTLAQCDAQTRELATQKAVKTFQTQLIASTTEETLVEANINKTPLNIHVLRSKTNQAEFYDGERYRALMDITLEARPSETTACTLLNVDKQYCFAPGYVSGQQSQNEQEIAWVTLNVRSNQYDDRVFVDGVSYGSTPVEIMLPIGQHHLVIKKEGYQTFKQNIALNADRNFRAQLKQNANTLKAGDQFADLIAKGSKAPQLATIVPGEYLLGENAANQYFLDHAFGISVTPITVGEFDAFVRQTDYQTDAELKNTCTAMSHGEVTAIAKSYWRNPGFKQSAQSPVVCISRNDANAYTKWLSQQTGYQYRLPSEDEWEIAARAGSQSQYWWGEQFVSGQANTGWSSSPWANTSTSPVKAFKPNPLGIYDSVGNVWQWTSNSQGIAKGGAWSFSPEQAAADERLYLSPTSAANYLGFRVVRVIN